MAIADRISAMYDHVGDIYDTLELGGDTTENKNIININTEIKREYKNFLAHGVDVLWNNWEKVSGTGETLSLSPTIKGRIQTDLKGNAQQNGTPTPDSPIPIQVVSGDNTIKVEGKNLFDGLFEIGTFNTDGINVSADNRIRTINYIKAQPNTQYTIKYVNNTQTTLKISVSYYTINDYTTPRIDFLGWSNANPISFTTPNNCEYLRFLIAYNNDRTITSTDILSNVQLEKNNQATPYQPYQSQTYPISLGNIELCKIGTYQDKIVKDNGKWYLNKQIGKKIVLESEILAQTDSYTNVRYFKFNKETNDIDYNKYNETSLFYSHATLNNDYNYDIASMIGKINPTAEATRYWVGFSKSSTLSEAQEKLTNSILYYPLKTPTYEEITDSSLKEQLNNLENAMSYDSQTNISQTNDDMPFILDITALKEMS